MQSRLFGIAWVVHQTLPRYIDRLFANEMKNSAVTRASITLSTFALARVLPCKFCRESYVEYLQRTDFDHRIQKSANLPLEAHENFWFDIHNLVNAKLDKPILTVKEPGYTEKTAKNVDEFLLDLLDWFCMLVLNQKPIADVENMKKLLQSVRRIDVLLPHSTAVENFENVIEEFQDAVLKNRAWLIVYILSILRILLRCEKEEQLVSFAKLGLQYLSVHSASTWQTPESIFSALYRLRSATFAQKSITSESQLYKKFDSFRAGRCVGNSCV